MHRRLKLRSGVWLFAFVALACGPQDSVSSSASELRHGVLRCDDHSRWSGDHGSWRRARVWSEGTGAVEVRGDGNVRVTSVPFPWDGAAPNELQFDLRASDARCTHGAQITVFLRSRSAGVDAELGRRRLRDLDHDAFTTLSFPIPPAVGERLAAAPRTDVSIEVRLTGVHRRETYVFDNFRLLPESTGPICRRRVAGERDQLEAGLEDDCDVRWFSGYETTPDWTAAWGLEYGPQNPAHQSLIGTGALDGAFSAEVTYPAGLFASESGTQYRLAFDRLSPVVEPLDAAYVRYYVRFDDDFDFVRGGKLPGLFGGTANTGGEHPTGTDGWSARMMWRADGRIVQYVYHPDQPTNDGEDFDWDDGASCQRYFQPGRWHCVESYVQLNTVTGTAGNHDGVVRSWLDGELALDRTDVRFRDTTALTVDGLYFSTFFGGGDASWAPSTDQHARFDDFVISEAPIGCSPDFVPEGLPTREEAAVLEARTVFDSDAAGWAPSSFSTGGVYAFDDATYDHTTGSGQSARIEYTAGAFGAAQFTTPTAFDASAYSHVVLWVRPSDCDPRFRISFRNGSTTRSSEITVTGAPRYHQGEWRIGEWNRVMVPIAELGLTGTVNRLLIKADDNLGSPYFHVDDVALVRVAGATTTPPPPAADPPESIFDSDGAGWTVGSFSTGGTYDFDDATQNHTAGGSQSARVQYTAGAFGAAQFTRSATLDLAGYSSLVLWALPTDAGARFRVSFRNGSTALSTEITVSSGSSYVGGPWRVGEWNRVVVPIAALAPTALVNRLVVKADDNLGSAPFYVDDIALQR